MKAGVKIDPVPNLAQGKVRDQLAAEAGVSKMTYTNLRTVNQKGSDELKEAKRPILEKQARERQKATQAKPGEQVGQVPPNLAEPKSKGEVRDQLAAEAGVSKMTYTNLRTINQKGSDELKEAVMHYLNFEKPPFYLL